MTDLTPGPLAPVADETATTSSPEESPATGATPATAPAIEATTALGIAPGPEATPAPEAEPGATTPEAEPAPAPDVAPATPEAEPAPPSDVAPAAATPRAGRRRQAALLGYLAVALLGAVLGAGALALAGGGFPPATASPSPPPLATSDPAAAAGNIVGRADAPVTIEVWADYQCPYCRLEATLFSGVVDREYVGPGIVRVVYRDFTFLGQESIDAAVAARCAGAQEPAARMRFHDTLFTFQQGENQGRFARANLLQMATIAGVPDQAAFTACLDNPAVAAEVAAETSIGRGLGVDSTPTLRLSGPGGERVLTGFSQTWPTLRDAIEGVRVARVGSPAPSGSPNPSRSPEPSTSPTVSAAPSPSASPMP